MDPMEYMNEYLLYMRGHTKINYRTMEQAVKELNINKFILLFNAGLDPNGYQEDGMTPLIYLIIGMTEENIHQYIEFFDILFEAGADINKPDSLGYIPIVNAFSLSPVLFQYLFNQPNLILNDEAINQLDRYSSPRAYNNLQMRATNNYFTQERKDIKLDIFNKNREILQGPGKLTIAHQNLATIKGYEDEGSVLGVLDQDLMDNVFKHISSIKPSQSIIDKTRLEQKGKGKKKSKGKRTKGKRSKKRSKGKRSKGKRSKKRSKGKKKR